jgi:DNA-binding beta-propeller fold protein YncE
VNQGNYSSSNGSLSILKPDGTVEQEVYTKANGGKLASIIESVTLHGDMLLLMCSNADKVEIIDSKTFKVVGKPINGIGIPRYCAVYKNSVYVTCTDSWDPNASGQVCKIDLATKMVIKKINVNGIPEGIKELNGLLYIAAGDGVTIIDPNTDEIVQQIKISEQGVAAKQLRVDYEGKLWVSFTSIGKTGIASLNVQTNEFSSFIPLENMDLWGSIDMTPDGKKLLYLYAAEVVGAQSPDAETSIYSFDIKTLQANHLIRGAGFYGFNVNPSNGDIYTANVNGFITNSVMYIYDASGEKINDGLVTGVGSCRFIFPKIN